MSVKLKEDQNLEHLKANLANDKVDKADVDGIVQGIKSDWTVFSNISGLFSYRSFVLTKPFRKLINLCRRSKQESARE